MSDSLEILWWAFYWSVHFLLCPKTCSGTPCCATSQHQKAKTKHTHEKCAQKYQKIKIKIKNCHNKATLRDIGLYSQHKSQPMGVILQCFIQQQCESFKLRKRRPALDLLCLNCFCFLKYCQWDYYYIFPLLIAFSSDSGLCLNSVIAGFMSEQVMLQKKNLLVWRKLVFFACYLKFAHKNNPSISDDTI